MSAENLDQSSLRTLDTDSQCEPKGRYPTCPIDKRKKKRNANDIEQFPNTRRSSFRKSWAAPFWEWPRKRTGHATASDAWKKIIEIQRTWRPCRIGGYKFHMKMPDAQAFVNDPWAVITTRHTFHENCRDRTCLGKHGHDHCWGRNFTASAAYYPQSLCKSIAQLWKQRVLGDQNPYLTLATTLQSNNAGAAGDSDNLLPNVAETEQPSSHERYAFEQFAIRMHNENGHANLHGIAKLLAETNKEAWNTDLGRNYANPICKTHQQRHVYQHWAKINEMLDI